MLAEKNPAQTQFYKKIKMKNYTSTRIYCCTCGKQAVDRDVSRNDKTCTILKNSRAGFKNNEVFCGYCAEELDENGLFPEERMQEELYE